MLVERANDEKQTVSRIWYRLASRDGVDFCNRIFARLNYKLHSTLPDGLSEYFTENVYKNGRALHFKWPEFEWENAGGAYRLKINNEGVDGKRLFNPS